MSDHKQEPTPAGGEDLEARHADAVRLSEYMRKHHGWTINSTECALMLDVAARLGIVQEPSAQPTGGEAVRDALDCLDQMQRLVRSAETNGYDCPLSREPGVTIRERLYERAMEACRLGDALPTLPQPATDAVVDAYEECIGYLRSVDADDEADHHAEAIAVALADLDRALATLGERGREEICCGEYATCSRPCVPRGRWQAEQGREEAGPKAPPYGLWHPRTRVGEGAKADAVPLDEDNEPPMGWDGKLRLPAPALRDAVKFALMTLPFVPGSGEVVSLLREAMAADPAPAAREAYQEACVALAEGAMLPVYGSPEDFALRSAQSWPDHLSMGALRQAASRRRVELRKAEAAAEKGEGA